MSDGLSFHGTYTMTRLRAGAVKVFEAHNTLTWEGAASILRGGLLQHQWQIAFKNGGEGSAENTAANKPWHTVGYRTGGNALWVPVISAGSGFVAADNFAAPAHVVIEVESVAVDGICILSEGGDVLLSVAEWYAEQELMQGDEFFISYELEGRVA